MNDSSRNIFRAVAAAYLLYLGVTLSKSAILEKPDNMMLLLVFGVLFIVVGAVMGIRVIRLIKSDKASGSHLDENAEENTEENTEDTDDSDAAESEMKGDDTDESGTGV